MEKFLLMGFASNNRKCRLSLGLPTAKHYEINTVKNGEETLQIKSFITNAVEKDRKKLRSFHVNPVVTTPDGDFFHHPRTLHHILSGHPFPLSQGPVILPLDCGTEDSFLSFKRLKATEKKSEGQLIKARTMFTHSESQDCGEWCPVRVGISAWVEVENRGGHEHNGSYEVKDLKYSVQGSASTKDMGVVYTCQMLNCVIHCPCSICNDNRNNCRLLCKREVCQDCNSQCIQHQLKLTRLFNADTDHFMLLTDNMKKYRFANPYAGIPISCNTCTKDVLEHQVFHLVFHLRCRFCRHEIRPFEQQTVVTIEDYRQSVKILNWAEDRTCSFCLIKSHDKYGRERHEETIHEKKEQKFKCEHCNKSYSNTNALKHHITTHNPEQEKFTCDICGSQFSTKRTLARHKQIIHDEAPGKSNNECENCGQTFSVPDALNRHMNEQHFGTNVNLDYVENMDSLFEIKCNYCEQKFKRKSNMVRHIENVHNESEKRNNTCPRCDSKFSRKDALKRHIKSKHMK